MTTDSDGAEVLDPLAAARSDHHCFGCGAQNPIGLRLRFTSSENGDSASFVPSDEHQGFDGIVHGGIISTVLDEAMAWATASAGIWAVTGEIRVRFRRPLRVGEQTIVTGAVTSDRGRLVQTNGAITSESDGQQIATATATFMRVDEATASAWRGRYLQPDAAAPE